jgi:hypothetical protein
MRIVALVCISALLAGCAKEMVYVRLDGRSSVSDPVLAQQFEVDRTICSGEMQKANVSGVTFSGGGLAGVAAQVERQQAVGQVAQGCMAQKGYLMVPKEEAEAKKAELAAITAEKKRREETEQLAAAASKPASKKKGLANAQN